MKNASTAIALALALAAATLGCGTFVSESRLNAAPRPLSPRHPVCVEVFSSAPPSQPHVDVALIDVNAELERPTVATFVQLLRDRGGQMGCDAIFIPAGQPSVSGIDGGARRMQATCVVYQEPRACAPPAPVAPARRICRDRQDFDTNRNCILAT